MGGSQTDHKIKKEQKKPMGETRVSNKVLGKKIGNRHQELARKTGRQMRKKDDTFVRL